ncbi:MAG TPA: PIN domain-containing protein [Solirubrobacteraceae bacterium]|nr:PIN domain-containing protein [Solirubrobacteraceae bacterium]
MARVALDADVLIAFLDAADAQHDAAVALLRPLLAAGEHILLSASVYAEIMVRPLQRGTQATVEEFLDAINATVVPIDRALARQAAALRAAHRGLRLPDALSLAAARVNAAELLTFDLRVARIAANEPTDPIYGAAPVGPERGALHPASGEDVGERADEDLHVRPD